MMTVMEVIEKYLLLIKAFLCLCMYVCTWSVAVFLVDDDMMVSAQDIQFAFRVWKVGLPTSHCSV